MSPALSFPWRRVLAGLLCAALAACGGGSSDTPTTPAITELAAGQQASQTLGTAGGSVVLATREGARFTLTVPAGAVPEGTAFTLQTAAATARQRFHLRLSPTGLLPAQPLTLTVELPATLPLPSGAALAYDGVPLPYTRLSDGRLELRLPAFAGSPAVAEGRIQAQRVRALASAPASACGGVPTLETAEGGLTAGDPIEADLYGQCMLGAVNALAAEADYAGAVRLASSLAAYLQKVGAANTDQLAGRFITEARTLACTAYGQALDTAAATTVTSFATLSQAVRPVLFWEHAVQQLGAVCPTVPATRYVDVVDTLTAAALRYYASRQGAVVDVGSVEYTEAVKETRAANDTVGQLRSLAAPAAVQNVARSQLQQRAQPAIVDAVLQAPWQRCRDTGNFDKLIELMQTAASPAAVKTAAQYCGTQLQAQAKSSAGTVTATLTPPLGGVSAGSQRSSGSLDVAKDGTLVLSGPIRALQCPAGSTGGTESLQLKLGDTVLQTLSGAPYLATELGIDIAQALQTAGINAGSFTSATLTLTRTGSPCGGFWGSNPEPLLSLNLSSGICAPAAGQHFCATAIEIPGSVDIGSHELVAVNDAGEVLYREFSTPTCRFADAPQNAPCAGVWRRGSVRQLPNRFSPVGISNNGTVAGNVYTGSAGTAMLQPAVATPGRSSAIVLATPIPQSNGDPPSGTGYLMDTISPNGRVTYHLVRGGYGYSGTDYGFCTTSSGGSAPYCWKEQFFETSGPDYGAGTQVHLSQLPDGEGRTDLLFDNDAQGRGGQLGLYGGNGFYASLEFRRGEADVQLQMMDRSGATLVYERNQARRALRDSSATLRDGFEPTMLGLGGHGLACKLSDQGWQAHLFDTAGGAPGETLDASFAVRVGADELQVSLPCNPTTGRRLIDGLGRIVADASSDARPRLRGVILTPAGVALP